MIVIRQKEFGDKKDQGRFWSNDELNNKIKEERAKAADKAVEEYAKTEEAKALKAEAEKRAKEKIKQESKKEAEKQAKKELRSARIKRVRKWLGIGEEEVAQAKGKTKDKLSKVAKWLDNPRNAKIVRRSVLGTAAVGATTAVGVKVYKTHKAKKAENDVKKKLRGYDK